MGDIEYEFDLAAVRASLGLTDKWKCRYCRKSGMEPEVDRHFVRLPMAADLHDGEGERLIWPHCAVMVICPFCHMIYLFRVTGAWTERRTIQRTTEPRHDLWDLLDRPDETPPSGGLKEV